MQKLKTYLGFIKTAIFHLNNSNTTIIMTQTKAESGSNLGKVIAQLDNLNTKIDGLEKKIDMQVTEILTKLSNIQVKGETSRAKRGDGSKSNGSNGAVKGKVFPGNSLSWFIQKYKTDKKFIETNYNINEDDRKKIEKFMDNPENKGLSDDVRSNKECTYIIKNIIKDNKELKLKMKEQFEAERDAFDEKSKETLAKEETEEAKDDDDE